MFLPILVDAGVETHQSHPVEKTGIRDYLFYIFQTRGHRKRTLVPPTPPPPPANQMIFDITCVMHILTSCLFNLDETTVIVVADYI
jgi:hypothetical protein